MSPFLNYLLSAIPLGMTFLYGSTGEILTEKTGHLNLGIPGIMCMGGASGCLAISFMYQKGVPGMLVVLIAILAAFLGGALMGLLYSFLCVTLHANQNVTGLVMTTFGVGTMKYIMSEIPRAGYYTFAVKYFRFPFASFTNSLNYCGIMVYLAIVIALISSFVLMKTRVGLHLRSVGESPATADAMGINVTAYKYIFTCIGSGIAALGGIYYCMSYSGTGEAYKSIEALGWLSVALVIFAMWKPWLSILGSALFGALYIAGFFIPNLVTGLSMGATPLLKMLPYVVTIVVLIITSIRKKRENQPPASLGLPYFREDR